MLFEPYDLDRQPRPIYSLMPDEAKKGEL